MKLRHALFNLDSKYKKKAQYKDDESDLDDEWITEHEESLKAKEIEKVEKKFAKENEKLEEDGKKLHPDSILQERIEEVEAEFEQLAKERRTGKADAKNRSADKIEEAIDKLTDKIKSFKLQMVDRDAGKEVALGTRCARAFCVSYAVYTEYILRSKINYLDPRQALRGVFVPFLIPSRRITAAWCQIHDVPIEKIFSKTLITKCKLRYSLSSPTLSH